MLLKKIISILFSFLQINLFLFITFFSILIFAQNDSLKINKERDVLSEIDLEKLYISDKDQEFTTGRSRVNVNELPVSVFVITKEEIRQNEYTTLADVLAAVPGIRVSQPGSAFEGETFIMRGLHGNYYTKILINNNPITPSVVSGMPISEQLPIRQAERIEIVFGPASSVYGADAMAGVINIVTENPNYSEVINADVMLGNRGNRYFSFLFGGKLGKNKDILNYTIYGNNGISDNLNVYHTKSRVYNPLTYDSDSSFLSYSDYHGTDTLIKMNRLPSESNMQGFSLQYRKMYLSVDNMYRKSHSSIGLIPTTFSYYDPNTFIGQKINRFLYKIEVPYSDFQSSTIISYVRYRMDNASSVVFNNIIPQYNTNRLYYYEASDDILAEQIFSFWPTEKLDFLIGASIQKSGNLPRTNVLSEPFNEELYIPFSIENQILDSTIGNFGYNSVLFFNRGIFGQAFYRTKKINIMLGSRYDNHSIYGKSFNPRLALLYKINKNFNYRMSYSSAFRAPSSFLLNYSEAIPVQKQGYYNLRHLPNPDLIPELLDSYECGLKFSLSQKVKFDVSYYHQIARNIISRYFAIVDIEKYPFYASKLTRNFINDQGSKTKLNGIQLFLEAKDLDRLFKTSISFNYTYSFGKDIVPIDTIVLYSEFVNIRHDTVNELRNIPKNLFYGRISFELTKWMKLTLVARHSDKWLRRFLPLISMYDFQWARVPSYNVFDIRTNIIFNKNLQGFFEVKNVTNVEYGGIGSYSDDNDLLYNPQNKRLFRIGLNYYFN